MSNTASVTPYDSESTNSSVVSGAAFATSACLEGAVAVARWLVERTPDQEAAIAAANERDKARRVDAALRLTSVGLHLREASTLLSTAKTLGYLPAGTALAGVTLLQDAGGNRLAIERVATGKLVVHAGTARATQALLYRHTLDQVQRECVRQGMDVRVGRAGNEVQITGVEKADCHGNGRAVVRADVRRDGTVNVDISGVKGTRCETILGALAESVGGETTTMSRKREYFESPGEATRASRVAKVGK